MNAADRRVLRTLLGTALAVVVLSSGLVFAQGWPFRPSSGGGLSSSTADAAYLRLDASNDPVTGALHVDPADSATPHLTVGENGGGDMLWVGDGTPRFRVTSGGDSETEGLWPRAQSVFNLGTSGRKWLTTHTNYLNAVGNGASAITFDGCTSCALGETYAEEMTVKGTYATLDAATGIRFRDGGIMLTIAETGVNEMSYTFTGDGSTGSYSSVVSYLTPAVDPSDYVFRWYENGLQVLALDGDGQLLSQKIGAAGSEVSTLYVDQLSNSTGSVVTDGRHVVSQLDLSGKGDYISTTPTALPTCDASTEGILIYVNDTNDSKHAQTCICGQLSGTVDVTLAWNPIGPGAGACPP